LGDLIGIACTSELRANLVVEVRDSLTGAPAAWGATGIAVHDGGRTTTLSAFDSLHLGGSWAREQAGGYHVSVRKPGYTPVETRSSVDEDACHVKTGRVQVRIAPNPQYSSQPPLFLTLGEHVLGWNASAGIITHADTLIISGRAYAPCTRLTVLATRSGRDLHVQAQPEDWSLARTCSEDDRLQNFNAAFLLPTGGTDIYLTNGYGDPTVLFSGSVWVQ
jgi:hypothetical protein